MQIFVRQWVDLKVFPMYLEMEKVSLEWEFHQAKLLCETTLWDITPKNEYQFTPIQGQLKI